MTLPRLLSVIKNVIMFIIRHRPLMLVIPFVVGVIMTYKLMSEKLETHLEKNQHKLISKEVPDDIIKSSIIKNDFRHQTTPNNNTKLLRDIEPQNIHKFNNGAVRIVRNTYSSNSNKSKPTANVNIILQSSRTDSKVAYEYGYKEITDRIVRNLPPNVTLENVDIKQFMLRRVINKKFNISYRHNRSDACIKHDNVRFIIAVPSAANNFKRREKVRKSLRARYASDPKNGAVLLFFLGMPDRRFAAKYNISQAKIESEQVQHGDIVQATFIDMYRGMASKSGLMLHWATTFCSNAEFLIRTDDDVEIKVQNVVKTLENTSKKYGEHFIVGVMRHHDKPLRDKHYKNYLSEKEWPYKTFPNYVLGGLYGLRVKTGVILLEAMKRLPLIWLDDVFVTGVCAQRLGVKVVHSRDFYFKHIVGDSSYTATG